MWGNRRSAVFRVEFRRQLDLGGETVRIREEIAEGGLRQRDLLQYLDVRIDREPPVAVDDGDLQHGAEPELCAGDAVPDLSSTFPFRGGDALRPIGRSVLFQ